MHDRLPATTKGMDMSGWSPLVRQIVRGVEAHPDNIVIRLVVGDPVERREALSYATRREVRRHLRNVTSRFG